MVKLFRFIFGWIEFIFTDGFCENFINECFENGIEISNIALCDNGFTAMCNIKTYRKLHTIALHHGGKVRIIKKHGLPFILLPLKNRFGFFIGGVVFIFIVSFLGGFIWNVELVGNDRVSDTTLLTYLENNNLKSGAMWSGIDKKKLSWKMMSDFEDFAWVHINQNGTTARIEVNETIQKPETKDEDKLKGINVFRRELEVVAYREQSNLTLKKAKTYKTIIFFNAQIPLYFKINEGDVEEVEKNFLTIKGTVLPIGYISKYEKWFSSTSKQLSDDKLLALAKKKLKYNEEKEFDGYEIINRSLDYEIDDDKCVLTCAYVVKKT